MSSEYESAIQQLDTGDDDFTVKWFDGHESVFHYVWLRFSCVCPVCGDLDSRIGNVMMADILEEVSPHDACFDDWGRIYVVWNYGVYESWFEPGWLRAHCYSESARAVRRHQSKLWNASHIDRINAFDFAKVVKDDGVRLGTFEHTVVTDAIGRYYELRTLEKTVFITDASRAIA